MQIHSAISSTSYPFARPGGAQPSVAPAEDERPEKGALNPASTPAEGEVDRETDRKVAPASESDSAEQALTQDELREVQLLAQRDAEVRAHEQAHIAAGGPYVNGAASYSYQMGPDGKSYAIGGEVGIDTSMRSGDPEANLEKARTILRAALAPAEPSTQDRSVAADARAMEIDAQRELAALQQAEREAGMAEMGRSDGDASESQEGADAPEAETTSVISMKGARARLEQRIGQLFAEPTQSALNEVA
ncbi:putative metalloprotease CJM1_0395 family protein [Thiorhodococcus mannitoliphagus]|uniref:putative metalloprotease CJM1_0395 family protein n=1 Tax=Thiorhodococcus mannitoliphagus TaxID=329406 RepID=UPI001981B3CB